MCVSPTIIHRAVGNRYEPLEVACRHCWACRKNKVDDVVGRCLLELAESDWATALTLTYDDAKTPGEKRTVLHIEDMQRFLKRFRKSVSHCRYLVAGEYGSKRGRPHFHAVLFGKGQRPGQLGDGMNNLAQWPWGHVWVDNAVSEKSLRYVAKYLLKSVRKSKTKDENKFNAEWISYSNKPLLGYSAIVKMAERAARENLFPRSFRYRPPLSDPKRTYTLRGEARNVLLDHIFLNARPGLLIPETMERAVLAWRKSRHKRAWDNLAAPEKQKVLDNHLRARPASLRGNTRTLTRWLVERMEQENVTSIKEFSLRDPADYEFVRKAFGRDLTIFPPTLAEIGDSNTARALAGDGKASGGATVCAQNAPSDQRSLEKERRRPTHPGDRRSAGELQQVPPKKFKRKRRRT